MAHQLEIIGGKASMAYAGEKPWHSLGTKVSPDLTPVEMMQAANLDWEVEMVQAEIFYDGQVIPLEDDYACLRLSDKKVLTTGSKNWQPVQNRDAFEFFNEFVHSGAMQMETAGALDGGRKVWAMAKMTDSFSVFNGDEIKPYMLFSNPHKYGQAIDVRLCMERVVCANTLAVALGERSANVFRISHVQQFDEQKAKMTIGIATEQIEKFKLQAKFLGSKSFKKDIVKEYFAELFPHTDKEEAKVGVLSEPAKQALRVLDTQPGANIRPGTWWQAFNAVTYLTNHRLGRGAETKANSLLFGPNQRKNASALELALEYAK